MANISKLTSDQISEMRRLHEEGATLKSLAERYGVSITTVNNKLKAPQVRPLTEEERKLPFLPAVELPEPLCEQLKKKEKPKRRIVGVNV